MLECIWKNTRTTLWFEGFYAFLNEHAVKGNSKIEEGSIVNKVPVWSRFRAVTVSSGNSIHWLEWFLLFSAVVSLPWLVLVEIVLFWAERGLTTFSGIPTSRLWRLNSVPFSWESNTLSHYNILSLSTQSLPSIVGAPCLFSILLSVNMEQVTTYS